MAEIDSYRLRSCLGRFATGVTVVTVRTDAEPHGLTVNSFTAISLDPPLILVSIGRRARGHDLLAGRPFAVNILGAEQERLARHFAGSRAPDLDVPWEEGVVAPRLAGALAYLECEPWRAYDGGDHTLYLGRVVAFDYRNGDGLGYFYSSFLRIEEPVVPFEYVL